MEIMISMLAFGAVFFGGLAVQDAFAPKTSSPGVRLRRLLGGLADSMNDLSHGGAPPEGISLDEDKPSMQRMRQRLRQVGLYRRDDLQAAMRFRRLCYLIPLVLVGMLFFFGFPLIQIVLAGSLFSVIVLLLPRVRLIRMAIRRKKEIERCLPDTLDLFTLCLEAGLSFDAAMCKVAQEQERISPHISRELKMTQQEIQAGVARGDALKNLGDRTEVEDVKTLTAAIIQSMKLGTSLVKTLRVQAVVIRQKKRERVRAEISRTPVKLLFPLLFFIFPTLLNVILGPTLITIFRTLSRPDVSF